jgi:hypothetical protein
MRVAGHVGKRTIPTGIRRVTEEAGTVVGPIPVARYRMLFYCAKNFALHDGRTPGAQSGRGSPYVGPDDEGEERGVTEATIGQHAGAAVDLRRHRPGGVTVVA